MRALRAARAMARATVSAYGSATPGPPHRAVAFIDDAAPGELLLERRDELRREHRDAVLAALAVADHDRLAEEVEVLHADGDALADPHARAVHEARYERVLAVHAIEDRVDLGSFQDCRQPARPLRPDDVV
jgi:hypothetical protein